MAVTSSPHALPPQHIWDPKTKSAHLLRWHYGDRVTMGQFSNSFPKHFSYLCEYAIRFDLSCSFCEYPFIFHCLHCSPSCFDPDSLLLAYLWLGLSWIDCISANKSFSSPKTSSRKPYTSSKQQERQKHSVETTINFSPTPAPTPRGARSPKPGRGKRDRAAPPKQAKRSTGPRPDTRRGRDRVERPYQRPARGPHKVRAPHQPGEGGGRGRRESASAHTHKGHAGKTRRAPGPSPWNAQTAWNGVPASEDKGHPDGTARHTQRRKRGAGRGKQGRHNTRHQPQPPQTGRERRTHTIRALHLPRQ